MFAKIGMTKSIRRAVLYNEVKIKNGQAELLGAENFIKDSHQLSERDKFDRFLQRTSLNERAAVTFVHLSLGFDKSEKVSNEQMRLLVKRYMAEMGFAQQPYLMYRHYDTGHPHCHIVTTTVRSNGSHIHLTRSEFRRSRQITRDLERQYALSGYEKISKEEAEKFKVRQAQRVLYGESGLKHAISDVLNTVIDRYSYTTLQELNAILSLYNVRANPGGEDSRIREHKGLLYHAIDEQGRKIGKSIRASDFLLRPTLARLEERFLQNAAQGQMHQERVTGAINWTLAGTPPDWAGFRRDMEREGIDVVVLGDKKDGSRNVYFVDHDRRAVFAGARLGVGYVLEAIRERCTSDLRQEEELEEMQRHRLRLGL